MHKIILFKGKVKELFFSPGNAKSAFRSGSIPHVLTFTDFLDGFIYCSLSSVHEFMILSLLSIS